MHLEAIKKSLPFCLHRYALFVSYIGTKYLGSQRLTSRSTIDNNSTIQGALDNALLNFLPKSKVITTSASRTDKGVHALMNVFTLIPQQIVIPTEVLRDKINFHLYSNNNEIVVNQIALVPVEFHPRRDAKQREYIYRIAVIGDEQVDGYPTSNKDRPSDLFHLLPISELYRSIPVININEQKVKQAATLFCGQHNFGSFTTVYDKPEAMIKHLNVDVSFSKPQYTFGCIKQICNIHFKAPAFLYNQIRKIVGAILAYAAYDKISLADIVDLLANPNPSRYARNGMVMAQPWGLYLSKIVYDLNKVNASKSSSTNRELVWSENTQTGNNNDDITTSYPDT